MVNIEERKMPSEAQKRASKKYDAKTYQQYIIRLREDSDKELIEDIEKCKRAGIPPTEYLRRLYARR
jgi:hypothetical protein